MFSTAPDLPFPHSLPEFQRLFPDDAACAAYLEQARWGDGFACPHCGTAGEPFHFENRPGVLRCRKCRQNTGLTVGTVMERSHTPLNVWFWGAYLVASQTPGMSAPLADAMDAVHLSVDRFCLLAGVEALAEVMEEDATTVCGARHRRHGDRRGYRWGRTHSEIGYHGGKVKVARPRVRDRAGKEVSLESWQALRDGNLLLEWALNLMVLNVSTRKYHRAVRLPEGDLAKARGDGTSKSAVSRRFVALSRKKMKAWLASDLSELDLLVIQIDGLHVGDHVLMAAIGVDGNGDKHVLAVVEGATENTVVVQALIDNLLARGLDPTLPRLFIVDGAKALSKAIRNTFGVAAAIQRCQVHKGRNIIERLPQHLHASVKKALRQAWDQDDANKAERLLRNLVRRLEHEEPGVSGSILEGLDEILTVIRLGLPHELRRSLACTNIVENALGTVRQVTRNVKRWRHAEMALRWTAAGLLEAQKTFRRLKAYRQLPILRNALQEHLRKAQADSAIETIMKAA